jgi:hypothetical protein
MEGYITVQQASGYWGVTPRQVQLWCKTNKICGAIKWGRDWAIPEKAERPTAKKIQFRELKNKDSDSK